ncbi:hypothetical protein THAOC_12765 [Thalassiosira oceanica]|uniref:Uncharacterized protein n=1 Tax=Thalassiosira oceanica TaxID=159749 RepID=K0SJA9_THAOC|nr:hypothetical protein THAOC_12765 [Thalassiosira oceanica]|mmetsp:Transcript_19046/g.44616  ORF Transcript_19046/g.44616 Transcript_19046/m.44616 type:complete len:373 (+) Transcript_19046:26-1144(+)|eukprot:EJK66323.1 hypothetical protein THAOC_12765 [Thalassiosira oceanica]
MSAGEKRRRDDREDDADDAIAPPSVSVCLPRDEKKRQDEVKQKFLDAVGTARVVLGSVVQTPELWASPHMEEVRRLAYMITGDPTKWPSFRQREGWGKTVEDLTKAIGKGMYERTLSTNKLDGSPIILQIIQTEETSVASDVGNTHLSTKKWKLAALDGDGIPIVLRVDSTLNAAAALLTPGTIVAVSSFVTLYFSYSNSEDLRCAMVVKEFERVGYQPFSLEDNERVKSVKLTVTVRRTVKTKTPPEGEERTIPVCQCDGTHCSKHGVHFIQCVTKCMPVSSVSLELVARDCCYATKAVAEMTNSEKRFLLYYYYATSVYQFCGKGNRVQLPECLIAAVRGLYPPEKNSKFSLKEVEKSVYISNGDIKEQE